MSVETLKVALIGNPNTGKTSVFNHLTGLNQQVGNYPGITVEKKVGYCKLTRHQKAKIIDLPGTYSLNASSLDESVVIELLMNKKDENYPDVAVVVSEVENLKRNLLLFTQIKDLEIPTILVINMSDRMKRKGISIDIETMEKELDTKIALVSSRTKDGIDNIKTLIKNYKNLNSNTCLEASDIDKEYFARLQNVFPNQSLYKLWLVITQDVNFGKIEKKQLKEKASFATKSTSEIKRLQQKETIARYKFINNVLKKNYVVDKSKATDLRGVLDRILTHKIFGYVIFFGILLFIFQLLFHWSSVPMDFIDSSFASLGEWTRNQLSPGKFTDLLVDGIIAGLGGVVIFIPQIAFLFLFISILEESGYMSRVVFLMDRIMRRFGLSGKSVVPLISGTACAIPAIMATRNIESWKERLITILVTPFTTCSARLPVYAILIALVIPNQRVLGIFNTQGLTLMLLYVLGFASAVIAAYVLNKTLKIKSKSYFVVEMPNYKVPLVRNVFTNVFEKTKTFLIDAGKIILAISIILWFLASYGPSDNFNNAEEIVKKEYVNEQISDVELDDKIAAYKLEHSYIGIVGKTIEPVIKPLGYDWKIGIALVTSFAAREVFVGTLATIYSVGSAGEEEETIKQKMAEEVHPNGQKIFTLASGISLLLFYAFAMQCMATLAIVKKETNSWKWPIIQLVGMSTIAYFLALIAFQFLK